MNFRSHKITVKLPVSIWIDIIDDSRSGADFP